MVGLGGGVKRKEVPAHGVSFHFPLSPWFAWLGTIPIDNYAVLDVSALCRPHYHCHTIFGIT